jgi:hypothetical protein
MSQMTDIVDDELEFASLTLKKLIGRIDGLLSVGLGQLLSSVNARSFFSGRDRLIKSLAVVLTSTGAMPGSDFARDFSAATAPLEENLDRFYTELRSLADWRRETLADLDARFGRIDVVYSDLSETFGRLRTLLGMTADGWTMGDKTPLVHMYQRQFRAAFIGPASMAV